MALDIHWLYQTKILASFNNAPPFFWGGWVGWRRWKLWQNSARFDDYLVSIAGWMKDVSSSSAIRYKCYYSQWHKDSLCSLTQRFQGERRCFRGWIELVLFFFFKVNLSSYSLSVVISVNCFSVRLSIFVRNIVKSRLTEITDRLLLSSQQDVLLVHY